MKLQGIAIAMWTRWHRYRLQARRWLGAGDQDVLAARCAYYLNRVAKSRGYRSPASDHFYTLKNLLVEHFYLSGFCTHVSIQIQEMLCWGYRDYGCGPDCGKCGGTGVYRTHHLYKFVFSISGRTYVWHQPVNLIRFEVDDVEMGGKFERRDGRGRATLLKSTEELYYCTLFEYLRARGMTDNLSMIAKPDLWRGIRYDVEKWWRHWKFESGLYHRWKKVERFLDAATRFYHTGEWEVVDEIPF